MGSEQRSERRAGYAYCRGGAATWASAVSDVLRADENLAFACAGVTMDGEWPGVPTTPGAVDVEVVDADDELRCRVGAGSSPVRCCVASVPFWSVAPAAARVSAVLPSAMPLPRNGSETMRTGGRSSARRRVLAARPGGAAPLALPRRMRDSSPPRPVPLRCHTSTSSR